MKSLLGAALGCLLAFAAPAAAFENYEHKRIGDIAAALAWHLRPDACDGKPGSCDDLNWSGARTYGDIVQCVDDHLTPEKLLSSLREISGVQAGAGALVPDTAFPSFARLRDRWGKSDLCKYVQRSAFGQLVQGLRTAQAMHNNHAHFQEEGLVSLAAYHSLALAVARDEGNLGRALLVNAVADHYLHDLFAPGHIVTPRKQLSDTVATAMHDYHNREGASYYVNYHADREQKRGNPALAVLRRMGCLLEGPSSTLCLKPELRNEPELQKVWCELLRHPNDKSDCGVGPSREESGKILDAIRNLTRPDDARKKLIRMKGDGLLWCRDCADALYQRLFIVAVELVSLLEVLDASLGSGNANNFSLFTWKYENHWDVCTLEDLAYAALPFGVFSIGPAAPFPPELPAGPTRKTGDCSTAQFFLTAWEGVARDPGDPLQDNRSSFDMHTIFRVTAGREAVYKGSREGRAVASIEAQPSWIMSNKNINFGLGYGFIRTWEDDVRSRGALVRWLWTMRETETTVSVSLRRMLHEGALERGWRTGWIAGFEQGFSSYFSVYVGAGRDYAALPGGPLSPGWMFTGAIAFSLPSSRLW